MSIDVIIKPTLGFIAIILFVQLNELNQMINVWYTPTGTFVVNPMIRTPYTGLSFLGIWTRRNEESFAYSPNKMPGDKYILSYTYIAKRAAFWIYSLHVNRYQCHAPEYFLLLIAPTNICFFYEKKASNITQKIQTLIALRLDGWFEMGSLMRSSRVKWLDVCAFRPNNKVRV